MTNYRGWMTVFFRNARVHCLVRPLAGQQTSAMETDVLIDNSHRYIDWRLRILRQEM